jgi:hypothetical protein
MSSINRVLVGGRNIHFEDVVNVSVNSFFIVLDKPALEAVASAEPKGKPVLISVRWR